MRLTERKSCYPQCDKQGNLTKVDYIEIKNKGLAEEKLCQLEDIEDELGIGLITFFKALKNGVYYFANGSQLIKAYVLLLDNDISTGPRNKLSYSFRPIFENQVLSFKDYGRTWALTKEELE